MNVKIKELAEQATTEEADGFKYFDKERFAELIVQECMRMCEVAEVGYYTHGHTKEANGCVSAKEYIAEHFGVE
jgi:hypothetical protein